MSHLNAKQHDYLTKNTPSLLMKQAFAPIKPQLKELESSLYEFLPQISPTAQKILNHIFSSGGKRIRPATFFLASQLFEAHSSHKMAMAVASEYVHTASLLHDDVIDNSSLRRNKPTANKIWGDESSVLVGDLIYARASELMADTGQLEIVKTFAKTIRKMSEGELIQLQHIFDLQQKKSTYFAIIEAKTGALISASFKTAALLSQQEPKICKILETIGHFLGVAFQIIDDTLDYIAPPELFGKKNHHDLSEGKITLPIIFLREQASTKDYKQLETIILQKKQTPQDIQTIQKLLTTYGCIEQSFLLATEYTQKAIFLLEQHLPKSKARAQLKTLANVILGRLS